MSNDLTDEEIERIKEQKRKELKEGKEEYFKRQIEKKKARVIEAEELSDEDKKYYKRNISNGPIPEFEYIDGDGKSAKKGKEEDKEDNKKTYPIYKYSQGIPLAEASLVNKIPYFIQIIDGKPVYKQKIELSDINIIPPDRTEHISKEYEFVSFEEIQFFIDLAKITSLDSLFNIVRNELRKYIDVDDDFINILAADIIFTYFQDRLGMTHYLLIVGDNNVGKSNILLTFSFLGYRAILDMSITPANIYNFGSQLEEGQCIIIEDEIDDILKSTLVSYTL